MSGFTACGADRRGFDQAVVDYSSTDATSKAKAAGIIQTAGKEAAPWLLERMRTREAVGGVMASRARVQAAQAIAALPAPAASALVPDLVREMNTNSFPSVFATALAQISPAGIEELLKALESPNAKSQQAAAAAIQALTPADAAAVKPLLARLTGTKTDGVRVPCIRALAAIHAQPGLCVPVLLELVNQEQGQVRGLAAFALGNFKMEAKTATAILITLAKDKDRFLADMANRSAWQIDEAAAQAAGLKKPLDQASSSK